MREQKTLIIRAEEGSNSEHGYIKGMGKT